MNFPSQLLFNDINHGHRAALLKKSFFVAASILYGCDLLTAITKSCAEQCSLQLYRTPLTCLVLDHNFFKTLKRFFAKIPFFANHQQVTYFLWSLEENEYAGIKNPINLKHPEKLTLVMILSQRVDK